MQAKDRLFLYVAAAFALLPIGCAPGAQLSDATLAAAQNAERGAASVPFAKGGFPKKLNSFPDTISARPICQKQIDNHSAQCHANENPNAPPLPNPSTPPSQIPGYQPSDLTSYYGFDPSQGAGQTVAVVVAYDETKYLESDLNVYRSTFGLGACTVSNGCLSFLFPAKKAHKPDPHSQWPIEADIDAEIVSAVCPNCHIMVAEAVDQHIQNMAPAVDLAAAHGATEISNSWSLPESTGAVGYASSFVHPGIPITAGAGDGGYAVAFPADLATVIAVGGTTLDIANGQESVWSLTGSGCSQLIAKPSYQTDSGCANRTMNDVAVLGDPATGVAVFSTTAGGWTVFGGTSVGAPMVAAMYALQGNAATIDDATSIYQTPYAFRAIASGSNGTCHPAYLCTATGGYSGPTGVGTPVGTSGF